VLKELRIQNFVLIDSLVLAFESGICLLTGETGAGKSILIDAVATALGGRVSLDLIRSGANRAVIEATFAPGEQFPRALTNLLEEEGIELAVTGEITLARELSRKGARCRIDGQQVTQGVLRRAGQALVDILSQHEHQALMDATYHLDLLDRFGRLEALRDEVKMAHQRWSACVTERHALIEGAQARAQQQDFWHYQLQEIQQAQLQDPEEADELRQERLRLSHIEQLRNTGRAAYESLYAGENGPSLYDQVGRVANTLGGLGHLDTALAEVAEQLGEVQSVLRDAVSKLRGQLDGLDADPARLEAVEERLDLLNGLGRKYGPGLEKVMAHGRWLLEQLNAVETVDARLATLDEEVDQSERHLRGAANHLTAERVTAASQLEVAVETQLRDLELPDANFKVGFLPIRTGAAWRATGQEGCEFEIAMNPGEPPRPLAKTASGGEMARVMLALKTVLAGLGEVPTLIFDEVDTGISGKAAQAVAEKLAGLGRHYQILCITHLPTVAAMADQHMHLEKHVSAGRTQVTATVLDAAARVRELASLSSGTPAPKALQHAEELLGRAMAFKSGLDPARSPARKKGALANVRQ
jgi:DNA repair protein RecN (Recombination protein N)